MKAFVLIGLLVAVIACSSSSNSAGGDSGACNGIESVCPDGSKVCVQNDGHKCFISTGGGYDCGQVESGGGCSLLHVCVCHACNATCAVADSGSE